MRIGGGKWGEVFVVVLGLGLGQDIYLFFFDLDDVVVEIVEEVKELVEVDIIEFCWDMFFKMVIYLIGELMGEDLGSVVIYLLEFWEICLWFFF